MLHKEAQSRRVVAKIGNLVNDTAATNDETLGKVVEEVHEKAINMDTADVLNKQKFLCKMTSTIMTDEFSDFSSSDHEIE